MGIGIVAILRIGHDTSMRGAGLSLRDALTRADDVEARKRLDARALLPAIRAHRELIEQWPTYSEDKRTSGGWHLKGAGEVGQIDQLDPPIRFDSIEEAVAE